jgi:hypothetical protein
VCVVRKRSVLRFMVVLFLAADLRAARPSLLPVKSSTIQACYDSGLPRWTMATTTL